MSTDNVKAFVAKVREDQAVLNELKAIDASNEDAAVDQVVQIASKHGFEFTRDEYVAAANAEVSEDELAQMNAAGFSPFPPY